MVEFLEKLGFASNKNKFHASFFVFLSVCANFVITLCCK